MLKYIVTINRNKLGVTYNPLTMNIKIGGKLMYIDEIEQIKSFFTNDTLSLESNTINKGFYHFKIHLLEFKHGIDVLKKKFTIKKVKTIGRIFN